MPITKETRFRWVRPIAKHLNPEVQVWQPMMYLEYHPWGEEQNPLRLEYFNFYNVGHDPEECELGEWIEFKPLPPFGKMGLCNRQLSRGDSDLCTLPKNHKEPCRND